jgi:hypothetical protein
MHTAESLLVKLSGSIDAIVESYVGNFIALRSEQGEDFVEKFMTHIFKGITSEVAGAATYTLHMSISEGVDDQIKLVDGIQKLMIDSASRFNVRLSKLSKP